MRKIILISLAVFFVLANVASAKSNLPDSYGKDRGYAVEVSETSEWPVSVNTSYTVNGSVQVFNEMAVIRVTPYKAWYRFFSKIPDDMIIKISGLPENKKLHIYYNGYRTHTIAQTNAKGEMTLKRPTGRGVQLIIKAEPSTHHIAIDPLFGPPGGDCENIGNWDAALKTCTLTGNVFETVTIDDENITLDGDGYELNGGLTGDGIYTDVSSVTIKNVRVSNFSRGIVFADSFFTHAAGGWIENVTLSSNETNFAIDGVPSVIVDGLDSFNGTNGIWISDQVDSFPTDNIVFRNSTVNSAGTGVFADDVEVTFVRNNFLNNSTDIQNIGSTLTLNGSDAVRGNYWSKNTVCSQDPNSPDQCLESYNGDNMPWACEDAWLSGIDCPYDPGNPDPPTGGTGDWGEVSTLSGTTKLYESADTMSPILKVLPNAWAVEVVGGSDSFLRVKDHTDDTEGYILTIDIDRDDTRQSEFEEKAVISLENNINYRKNKILEAVSHYLGNSDANDSLYSSENNPNNFTEFESAGIVKELILGIIEEEIGIVNYDNDFVSFDYGHGLGQITTRDSIGEGSKISIPYCENSIRSTCYSETKRVPILNSPGISYDGKDYLNYRYYDNSHQSFYANIKDAFKVIQNKYASAKNFYNLNEIFSSRRTGEEIDGKHARILHTVRGYNSWGECPNILFNEANIDYLENVRKYTERAHTIFSIPTSERSDLEELLRQFDIVSREQQFMHVCSPAYLQVYDLDGNMTGFNGSQVVHEVPLVVYDEENHKQAYVLLDIQELIFRVVGEEVGTYSFPAGTTYLGEDVRFKAIDIPTSEGEIHEYVFDWENREVIVRLDQNGDGVFEKEFTSDLELTAAEFTQALNKVMICHIPPGNPLNAKEISIGESAVTAHLKHGDVEGSCDSSEAQEAIADKIEENNLGKSIKSKEK